MLSTTARLRALVLATAASASIVLPANAEVLFRGDMETGDLKQWSYLLKEAGLSVVSDPVAEGTKAGKVSISKNEVWDNGLNRVEVQHKPADAYLTEGKEIYYGFSFYLPETLTTDDHQIMYWETTEKYQQLLQIGIRGERIHLGTQLPEWDEPWFAEGKATAGKWHRLVMHIKWSADPAVGQVDLWFDGEQVVKTLKVQTFLEHPAFVQHGILRKPTIDKVEVLYFDDARSGTTLEDVLTPANAGGSGGTSSGGAGGQATGGDGTPTAGAASGGTPSGGSATGGTGGVPSGAGSSTGGTPSAGAPTTSGGATATPTNKSNDSSCAFSPRPTSGAAALAAILGLSVLRRRRR